MCKKNYEFSFLSGYVSALVDLEFWGVVFEELVDFFKDREF